MRILERHAAFVKDQIFLQEKLADKFRDQEWRAAKHLQTAAQSRALLADLEIVQRKLDSLPLPVSEKSVVSYGLTMQPEDLEDLPPEMLSELNLSETDKLDFDILEIIRGAGGVLSVNKILIGLYRKTDIVHKRPTLISRLHRMVGRKRLRSIQDRKGVFAIPQIGEEEVSKMLDGDPDEFGPADETPPDSVIPDPSSDHPLFPRPNASYARPKVS